jgi:membrane carboxypeptidase/penicillin-binding protein
MQFMQDYIAGRKALGGDPPEFQAPGNIVFLNVDKHTGAVTSEGAANSIRETFIAGTQPGGLSAAAP